MTSTNFFEQALAKLTSLASGFPASENHIGEVGGNLAIVQAGFGRLSNATPYAANTAVIRNGAIPISFPSTARAAGKTGYINSAICSTSLVAMTGQLRLHLFSVTPLQVATDGNPFIVHTDNDLSVLGWIDFLTFNSGGTGSNASRSAGTLNPSPLAFRTEPTSTTIFGLVQSLNAWTPTSGQNFAFQLFADRY